MNSRHWVQFVVVAGSTPLSGMRFQLGTYATSQKRLCSAETHDCERGNLGGWRCRVVLGLQTTERPEFLTLAEG